MTVCEWCWSAASQRAMLMGGTTGDRYRDVLEEQERLGPHAQCPTVRNADRKDPTP